ncbi:helix-hairpin-helix domain-containing protein [Streptomyces sp. ID05-04B]|uniref:helix-hairpin-helix domain-containing protein n=1 Tax=unclassified Streptomyces TaxID=2593676 RepID=UPI000D1BCC08|nr:MULTISPECIES: helix-hairpin-helix domain-containing protein [unclassified Streptomyces]AVV43546.1 DNA helicase RecD [Streptomyces sp. P3]MDX5564873.1 helix-hairpin-helix domain-containing protein [Streptomyces sp. ID05-04B]
MSTEPEPRDTTENTGPGTPRSTGRPATPDDAGTAQPSAAADDASAADEAAGQEPEDTEPEGAEPDGAEAAADGTARGTVDEGADGAATASGTADIGDAEAAAQVSEAQAELAAQKLERERIERRKAEKAAPITAGAKLSGKAADLLAAVRAVEGGAKPPATVFDAPQAAPRRAAAEPVRRPHQVPAEVTGPAAPAPDTVEDVRRVLADGGAPEALAPQTAAALGEGAGHQLREDPWQLLRVAGVRPEQADGFARALLGPDCSPDDERRGRAVTVWLLEQAALAGHTALDLPTLTTALGRQSVPDAETAVQNTLDEGEALAFQDFLDEPGAGRPASATAPGPGTHADEGEAGEESRPVRVLVGLERYALAEESLADALARVVNSPAKDSAAAWEPAAAAATGGTAELIRAVAGNGLVLHTGGEAARAEPAALLTAARALGLRAVAACHTPDGRRRLAALLGEEGGAGRGADSAVVTVRGLLSGAEGPGRDAEGAFALDLLVLLDAPQLDVESAAMLTESLPDGARLVLSGDPGVLWSAGPGRVFADLLAARVSPQIASRTPDPGPIGELVSGVGIGELNQVDAPGREIVVVPVRDAEDAVHRTVQLLAESVPRAFGVAPEEAVVITPGHGGAAGTRALNAALKERLNPGPGRFGGFDPDDRVAYSPEPGRTVPGRVVTADAEGLHLSCAEGSVVVPRERVERAVRHGWALTAHQAVGSRWPAAVVVLPGDAARALSRPWVYTAFGRAERHLSVVHGVEQALPQAVAEVPAKPRTTRLPVLLRTQVPAAAEQAPV